MPIQGIRAAATSRNGVGAFILQCKRIEITYCDRWASSQGLNSFLRHDLKTFAEQNPQIETRVSPKPHHHPVVKGLYINGREKAICVRNLEKNQILQKLNLIKEASGERLKRTKKPVTSTNESVRGIWSPYHGDEVDMTLRVMKWGIDGVLARRSSISPFYAFDMYITWGSNSVAL